ncbi:hypothetical protein CYMTET_49497 [Cymbomonas tetramitiformis]|uniref:Uncharacterized protein n=1 Tax=Cymbomonas tetramitiformis TaxID=36881 RepID=A0AAE0BRE0_9CHLO|nr:hypothetical protein CYMTET_49497 [Cymbomonas tetramitiformis]
MASPILASPVWRLSVSAPSCLNPKPATVSRSLKSLPKSQYTGSFARFQVSRQSSSRSGRSSSFQVLSSERCAVCEGSAEVNGKIVGSKTLRSLELLGADGNRRTISEVVGDEEKAVVWAEQQEKLNSAGVAGPIFISIGDAEKLNKFLELNPQVPREKSFVDDSSDFAAYQSAGFGKIGETEVKKVQMAKPELTGQQWFTYARNVMALSPVPKDLKFDFGVRIDRVLRTNRRCQRHGIGYAHAGVAVALTYTFVPKLCMRECARQSSRKHN